MIDKNEFNFQLDNNDLHHSIGFFGDIKKDNLTKKKNKRILSISMDSFIVNKKFKKATKHAELVKRIGYHMLSEFITENNENYLLDEKISNYLITIKKNQFYEYNGILCDGKYIAVIVGKNKIYAERISNRQDNERISSGQDNERISSGQDNEINSKSNKNIRNHSHLSAGNNVRFSGELFFNNGTLEWISNNSGHYKLMLHETIDLVQRVILDKLTDGDTIYFCDHSQRKPLVFNCDDLLENKQIIIEEGMRQDEDFFENEFSIIKVERPALPQLIKLALNNRENDINTKVNSSNDDNGYDSEIHVEENSYTKIVGHSSRFYGKPKKEQRLDVKKYSSSNKFEGIL